jgi:hypothetical protein
VLVTNTLGHYSPRPRPRRCDRLYPVRLGLVVSLNHPGGNVTGVNFISAGLAAKQLGLLRELRPGAARIAVLAEQGFPTTDRFISDVRAAAAVVGQQVEVLTVSGGPRDRGRLYNPRPTWGRRPARR